MPYNLIPVPHDLKPARSGLASANGATIHVEAEADTAADFLTAAVFERTGFGLEISHKRAAKLGLWIARSDKPTRLIEKARRSFSRVESTPESYCLAINSTGLAAAAGDEAGLFYAAATAAQLLDTRKGRPFWPSCTIIDKPETSFRGVHIDLKHHMDRLEYLWELVPRLASLKINALVLEIEDKFLYKRRGEISAPVGFSQGQLKEFVRQCGRYHIEFVPLVQGLGHASYILKHSQYAHLREKQGDFAEFCPQAEGTYEVLFDLYEEIAEATEGTKYFHIGGDEAWLVGSCPKCRREVEEVGKFALFKRWLDRCSEKIKALGRIPMVWDDMLIKHAGEDYSVISDELFYVRWNYRPNAAEICAAHIERYREAGLRVILASSAESGHPYLPGYMDHFSNIDGFGKAAAAAGLEGTLATTWEDSGQHSEGYWPGLAGAAQAAWNPSVDLDYDFMREFTKVFHNCHDGTLASVYADLGALAPGCFSLLSPKSAYDSEETYGVPSLMPRPSGERWRDFHASRMSQAYKINALLGNAHRVLSSEILDARRQNRYALEVVLATVRIMKARAELFFALCEAETAIEAAYASTASGDALKAAGLLEAAGLRVDAALRAGEDALRRLEALWQKTRLPQDMSLLTTPGVKYVHDYRNYRHLAAKTKDLGYLLFVERRMGADEFARQLCEGAAALAKSGKWPWA